jgi:hypothetical protein
MVGLLLLAVVLAHLHVAARGMRYHSPLMILDHVYVILIVALLLGLCSAVGSRAMRRWTFGLDQPLERLSFTTAVGAGVVATGILACGLAGRLDATIPFLFACGIFARREVLSLPSLARNVVGQLRSAHWASLVVFAAFMLALIVLAVAPPSDHDSLMYHVQVPVQFLRQNRIYPVADNSHTALVSQAHMLYLPLIVLAGQSAPAVLSAFITGLLGLGVFAYCLRFLDRTVANVALGVFWGSPILILVGVTPKVDVTLAWYLFLSVYAIAVAARERRPEALALSGLLVGMAAGIKYVALPFLLALAPLIVWTALRCARGARVPAARAVLTFGLLAAGGALPWLAKNTVLFGAPLFPVFAQPRMDPWLSEMYGGTTLPPGVDTLALKPLQEVRARFNLRDLLLAPGRLTPEADGRWYTLNPILAVGPAAAVLLPNGRWLLLLLVPAFLHPLALLVPYPRTNLRYLIPSIPLLTIAGAAVAVYALERITVRRRRLSFFLISLLCLTPAILAVKYRLAATDALSVAIGSKSRRDFLFSSRDYEISQHYWTVEAVNRVPPVGGHTVMLFEGRGLYFTVPVRQDNLLRTWIFLRPLIATGDCLDGRGISHILVADNMLAYFVRRGMNPDRLGWNEFTEFSRRCLAPVDLQLDGYTLYRIRSRAERHDPLRKSTPSADRRFGRTPGGPVGLVPLPVQPGRVQ